MLWGLSSERLLAFDTGPALRASSAGWVSPLFSILAKSLASKDYLWLFLAVDAFGVTLVKLAGPNIDELGLDAVTTGTDGGLEIPDTLLPEGGFLVVALFFFKSSRGLVG